jgi:hypothetical protein
VNPVVGHHKNEEESMELLDYFIRESPVVFLIIISMTIGFQLLLSKVRRLEEKVDLVMRAVNVRWMEKADRERTSELADHLYAKGNVEEAERLWAAIKPIQGWERRDPEPNKASEPSSRSPST